jgi:hypothetical protein
MVFLCALASPLRRISAAIRAAFDPWSPSVLRHDPCNATRGCNIRIEVIKEVRPATSSTTYALPQLKLRRVSQGWATCGTYRDKGSLHPTVLTNTRNTCHGEHPDIKEKSSVCQCPNQQVQQINVLRFASSTRQLVCLFGSRTEGMSKTSTHPASHQCRLRRVVTCQPNPCSLLPGILILVSCSPHSYVDQLHYRNHF